MVHKQQKFIFTAVEVVGSWPKEEDDEALLSATFFAVSLYE
jgi:hypothetical protein